MIRFCNQTDTLVSVAIAFFDLENREACTETGAGMRTRGWWNLQPGECKIPLVNNVLGFSPLPILFYAESIDQRRIWSGSQGHAYLTRDVFTRCLGEGFSSAYKDVGMRAVHPQSGDHTVNLVL